MNDPEMAEPLPISLVCHHVFCRRRAWLEAMGEQVDSYQMTVGQTAHTATDDPTGSRPVRHRAVDIHHPTLGLTGRVDTVVGEHDALTIVEYKATPVRRVPEVTDAMRIQLALQHLCLDAMGQTVVEHAIHFTTHHRTIGVELGPEDFTAAADAVDDTRVTLAKPTAPEPLQDDPRCMRCSHVGVCLPDERTLQPVRRRIHVADPDTQLVHLATPGSRASVSRGRMRVVAAGNEVASVPLDRIAGVVVHGNCDLSSALIREIHWRGLTIVWCTGAGRVVGWSHTAHSANGLERARQREVFAGCGAELAQQVIGAKIANQATLLRRNGDAADTVKVLRHLQRRAAACESTVELFGLEGDAAARYFRAFPTMLRGDPWFAALWPGRNGRGATDPLNVTLNYVYGVLAAETIRSVAACGLDPHVGFLHSSNRNKPALALDLMEEFRAPLADAVVISVINNGELAPADFSDALGSWRLRDSGRKALLANYERRLATLFTHPVFGYRITWRRAIEVQARLVLGVIDGSQPRYIGITTR
jgi:CRISPR-associated protein Cas1